MSIDEASMSIELDAVEVEVIGAAMLSVAEEMHQTLVRAAYSPNIKERRDCTTSLFDQDGQLLVLDEGGSPMHLGSLMGIISEILRRNSPSEIVEGDTFIGNDPYSGGGSHLPDIVLVSPVYFEGSLIGWVANLAHHADFGDRGHAHIFQEGIRIPPVRLARSGVIDQDLLDLILLNCQVPAERQADLQAQLAANRRGTLRLGELCDRYGAATIRSAGRALLDYTERKARAAIAAMPDGEYRFDDRFDCPELDEELTLFVRVEIRGDEILFDFAGNPPQVRASVNVARTALYATVYYALKTLTAPDLIANAGLYRPVRIEAPEGSIVNCSSPAAVNGRSETCQRIVDLIYGALATAVPERVTAASNGANTGVHYAGVNPQNGRYFVYLETIGGGSGARATKDGLDGVQVHMTNTSNLPVESLENEYPIVVEAYELIDDSGGAGRTRGGMGIRRRLRAEADDIHLWLDTTRQRSAPWGLFGGAPASPTKVELSQGAMPIVHGYSVLRKGDRVTISTAGGGGYGDPAERRAELLEQDLRENRLSRDIE